MPFFRFVGDPKARDNEFLLQFQLEHGKPYQPHDPQRITMFATRIQPGIGFRLNGGPVEISDGPRVAKLRGNRHFEEVDPTELEAGGDSSGDNPGQPREADAGEGSGESVPQKRGPGRPKGSKNKNVGERPAA